MSSVVVLLLAPGQAAAPKAAAPQSVEATPEAPNPSTPKKPESPDSPKKPEALRLEVNRLIRQLNADTLAERDAAERQLTALGPDLLPLLPTTGPNTPGEVRQRLARIALTIENATAEQSTGESRVTLSGKRSVADVFRAFEEQTGNKVSGFDEQATQEVQLELSDAPFMQGLDAVLDQIGMSVKPFSDSPGQLSLMARPEAQRPRAAGAAYSGAFRVEPIRVNAVRDLRNPNVEGLRLGVLVEWEPRIRPVTVTQALSDLKMTDNQGRDVVGGEAVEGQRGATVQSNVAALELDLSLPLPQRDATSVSLQGRLVALVPGRVETFIFASPLERSRGRELRKAGVTVTLDRARPNGDAHQISIRVRFDEASGALESHLDWIYQNEAYVLDAAGERIPHGNLEATRQANNEIGVSYIFPLPQGLDGCRFVYRTPSVIVQVPVPYELKDIPLP